MRLRIERSNARKGEGWSRHARVLTSRRRLSRRKIKMTNRPFRYAAPYICNQLPESFREPRMHLSISTSQSNFPGHARSPFTSSSSLHYLSPLLSFTADLEHTFSTNHFCPHHRFQKFHPHVFYSRPSAVSVESLVEIPAAVLEKSPIKQTNKQININTAQPE